MRRFSAADATDSPAGPTVQFGENVLRGDRASIATSAEFSVDLRQREVLPGAVMAQLRAEAHAAGYASAWAQGRRQARDVADEQAARTDEATRTVAREQAARMERAVTAVAAAASNLERRAVPAAAEIEDAIVEAAFALATAIVGRELATAAEPGREAMARAMALAPVNRPVTVRLSPADLLTLGGTGQFDVEGRSVTVVADGSLRSGDAMADCDVTTVDARIEYALDRVRAVLDL